MEKNALNKTVLIVDDEPDTLELVKLVLESAGFKTVSAANGIEALKEVDVSKPDLVLLDIMMPDMDGWEVFRKIKEKYSTLPIAILTAKAQNFDRLLGLHVLKADDYIIKSGLSMKDLGNKIKTLLLPKTNTP